MDQGSPHYYFEYDRPGKKKPGRTRWRMTLEYAAQHYPTYRPLMDTVEYVSGSPAFESFEPYKPGTGPLNCVRVNGNSKASR